MITIKQLPHIQDKTTHQITKPTNPQYTVYIMTITLNFYERQLGEKLPKGKNSTAAVAPVQIST